VISPNTTVETHPPLDVVTVSSQSVGLCNVGSCRLIMIRETITTDSMTVKIGVDKSIWGVITNRMIILRRLKFHITL